MIQSGSLMADKMAEDAVKELLGLYRGFGSSDYIGEAVTQLQHALQAAEQAQKEGNTNEVILGAFFHDIGHLIGQKEGLERMVTGDVVLGIQHHDKKGQAYLESMGVGGHVSQLVGMHVQAKRYLVATNHEYYQRLSDASKMTLEHQGGPMTSTEVEEFRSHPLKETIITMRRWDEQAKDPNKYVSVEETEAALETISKLLQEFLAEN